MKPLDSLRFWTVTAVTAASVNAQQGEGPQIGLQSGTAAGVRPGDGEHPRRGSGQAVSAAVRLDPVGWMKAFSRRRS